jgi:hypothetical protein
MSIEKEYLVTALTKSIYLLILLPSIAQAKFMLEPAAHHYRGSFSVGDESGNFTGNVANIMAGYLGPYFMAGIQLEKGQYVYDDNLTSDGYEKFDGGGVGSYIGFHFMDRFRILTGYLNTSLEPVDKSQTRYFGQHVSISLGYRIVDGLMVNFTDFRNQFTQFENDDTGKTEGLDSNIKTSGNSLSLSYVLAFE